MLFCISVTNSFIAISGALLSPHFFAWKSTNLMGLPPTLHVNNHFLTMLSQLDFSIPASNVWK
jgi:hypothetical protein